MHQKTYHCIYNEGLRNVYFPLSENNDECKRKKIVKLGQSVW